MISSMADNPFALHSQVSASSASSHHSHSHSQSASRDYGFGPNQMPRFITAAEQQQQQQQQQHQQLPPLPHGSEHSMQYGSNQYNNNMAMNNFSNFNSNNMHQQSSFVLRGACWIESDRQLLFCVVENKCVCFVFFTRAGWFVYVTDFLGGENLSMSNSLNAFSQSRPEPFNFLWWYPEKRFEELHDNCVDV